MIPPSSSSALKTNQDSTTEEESDRQSPNFFLLALGRLQRMKTTTGRRFHIEVDVEGRSHSGEEDLADGGRQQKRDPSLHDDDRRRASQKKL